MRLKRPFLFVPAVLAILALASVAVFWIGARTPMARHFAAEKIAGAIGLPAAIGSLRLGFFPSPAIEIRELRIEQPPGFGSDPFAQVEQVRVTVSWRSLFGADALGIVRVDGALVRLAIAPDGEANWSGLMPVPAVGPAALAAPEPRWSLGAFALERGALEFEDRSAQSRWRLTAITARAADIAPAAAFPLELQLGGVFGTHTMHYALKGEGRLEPGAGRYEVSGLEFRGWAGGEPMPLAGVELTGRMTRAVYEMASGVATLDAGRFTLAGIPGEFSGRIDFGAPRLEADVQMQTGVFPPRPPAVAFGHPLPATADPAAWQTMQLLVRGQMRDGVLHLDPVSGQVDDTHFEGRLIPGKRFIRASIDRVDVNRYLAPASRGASTRQKRATLEDSIANLAKFDIDAEIRVAEMRVGGARLRDAVIRVEPEVP